MAFREKFSSPNTAEIFKDGIFNITQAVGRNEVGTGLPAANRPTDMMLVYYFLFVICRDGDKKLFRPVKGDDFTSPEKLPPALDYTAQKTKTQIGNLVGRFQIDMRDSGRNVFVDARCDRGRGLHTTITHSIYTIHLLNFHYANTIKTTKGRSDWQDFLLNDGLTPAMLKQELQSGGVS